MTLEIIVLAAGQGTRMRSVLPKVLHPVGGKPMLMHVLDCAAGLEPQKIHVVTGFQGDRIRQFVNDAEPDYLDRINWVTQQQQNGTGHAVMQAMPTLNPDALALILFGDVPLVDPTVLQQLCHGDAALALLTAKPDSCEGLGRILRDHDDLVTGIVEQKDASDEQKQITEINTGIMVCQGRLLGSWLNRLGNHNSQGEYYLTDIVAMAVSDGQAVDAVIAGDPSRFVGVNSKLDLATAERTWQQLQAQQLLVDGVTLHDPARVDIRGKVEFGTDCAVDINVVFEGEVRIGNHVRIDAGCVIRNSQIGDHSQIHPHSVLEQAVVGEHCNVGPFARLRPDTVLANEVRIGNFVEVKKSTMDHGAKANHLAYVGDSTVGKNVNIGAGVITCNYDGANKHQTVIGDDVFVGSDTQLVAPVTVGDGATIGAGSTITKDVNSGDLAISRARQSALKNWARPVKKK